MNTPTLVQLARGSGSRVQEVKPRFFIGKFFAFGALTAVFGGFVIGAYLWLCLKGQAGVPEYYTMLRSLHIHVQTYLFFGLFILGFLLQTATKILRVPKSPPRVFFAAIPMLFMGVGYRVVTPEHLLGRLFVVIPFLGAFLWICFLACRGAREHRENYSFWVLMSLASLVTSAFFQLHLPGDALFFVWGGVVPVTYAAGQQFLNAFLGGKRLEFVQNRILLLVHCCGLLACLASLREPEFWPLTGVFMFLSVWLYFIWTQSAGAVGKVREDPLAFAFLSGYFWAMTSTALLVFQGFHGLDTSLHLVTLGWLSPLIIAVSAQVLSAIAGDFLLSRRLVFWLLLLWQFVPIGRGFGQLFELPPFFSNIVMAVLLSVLVPWLAAVVLSARRIDLKT